MLGGDVYVWTEDTIEAGRRGRRPAAGLAGLLAALAPVDLIVDDPVACVPRLAAAGDLAALVSDGVAVAVVIGRHRFDLTLRLDRALWRALVGALSPPAS
jgi:hypothetical protein